MIEFRASTLTYLWQADLRAAIEDIAEAGYGAVEVVAAPPHVVLGENGRRLAEDLRDACAAVGVEVSSVLPSGLDVNLASADGGMRDWSLRHFLAAGEFAAAAGARFLVVHPGRRHPFKPVPHSSARKLGIDGVSRIADALQGSGVRPVLENTPSSILDTAAECVEVVDAVGHEGLGVCYDVANGFMVENPVDGLRAVGDVLELVHLSDTTAAQWLHAPIGTGEVDFAAVARTLGDLAYAGPVVVETIHHSGIGAGLRQDLESLRAAGFGRS